MKKIFLFILISQLIFPSAALAASDSLASRLAGRILLQVESYGRAWYVHPVEKTRYYLKNGDTAYQIMREQSLGISNKDLAKIRTTASQSYDRRLTERLKGYILLQVEEHGEAWYVHPQTGIRYYLKDGAAAYEMMRSFSLGIANDDLQKIPVTPNQLVASYALDDVAYALYENGVFKNSYLADEILPIASLSKLMTALVLLDQNPSWNDRITISDSHINYPRYYVGDDPTSEVAIKSGQQISFYDLWVAMLLASANQAVAALVDSSGLSKAEFVSQMNQKAKDLGLEKTIFYDPAGLDAHNVSTVKEMTLLAQAAFSRPEIVQGLAKGEHAMTAYNLDGSESKVAAVNRNFSLMNYGALAAKTGFLVEAQRTAVLQKDNKLITIFHARSMSERNQLIEKLLTN